MEDTKPWYTSKTMWGVVIAFVALVAQQFGLVVDQTALMEIVLHVIQAVGLILAFIGRLGPMKKLTF